MTTVIKRDGRKVPVDFSKISNRLAKLCHEFSITDCDYQLVAKDVISHIINEVTTSQLDKIAVEIAVTKSSIEPSYGRLSAIILISDWHKNTPDTFFEAMNLLYSNMTINLKFYAIVVKHQEFFNSLIVNKRDFDYDYVGLKTLEKGYLLHVKGKLIERPQYALLRVCIQLFGSDLDKVSAYYEKMSLRMFIHATPTIFNSGANKSQLSSCFLAPIKSDSIEGIFDTAKDCAIMSKSSGGIGLSISNIRAKGSPINGDTGKSTGLVKMLKMFESIALYVDQGGGKRNGSFAVYIEPWHKDVREFIMLRRNGGVNEFRVRELFYALWMPGLFMERVKADEKWTLFCPTKTGDLQYVYGDEFNKRYVKYEEDPEKYQGTTIQARDLWNQIMETILDTGMPYMLNKDACNAKSNQSNLGTIISSNLCAEIVQYSSPKEIACCNLASINLASFVVPLTSDLGEDIQSVTSKYDFKSFQETVALVIEGLDHAVDVNQCVLKETKRSNNLHRPLGLGVQGLADVFAMCHFPYDSPEAKALNKQIHEAMYYAAVKQSVDMAKNEGYMYSSFEGSPASRGMFQFDLWGVTPSNKYDWKTLRDEMIEYGMMNSLLIALMPTVSTSTFLGANEGFAPFKSNIFARQALAGDFVVVNKHLVKELSQLKLWNESTFNDIVEHRGSIQKLEYIPDNIRTLFKTSWEISQRHVIQMAADRGPFVCQSQSMNLHVADPTIAKLTGMLMLGYELGLKTLSYYIFSRSRAVPTAFTVPNSLRVDTNTSTPNNPNKEETENACSLKDTDGCLSCGS